MTNVLSVAGFLLEEVGAMSTMKLQKLCYLSQGWHLAWRDEALFDEDFQAWKNGPVCYELFQLHRGLYDVSYADLQARTSGPIPPLSEDEKRYVRAAIQPYHDLSGLQLSEVTHEQEPWMNARQGISEGAASREIISKDSIRSFFSSLMVLA